MFSSIYQRESAELTQVFESAKTTKNIIIVALDYAAKKHVCLIVNGNGNQLRAPFPVHNNQKGVDFLLDQIEATCKRLHIQPQHVVVGGEDCPGFALNFLWALRNKPFCLVRVNAHDAKKLRENKIASTDNLDLLGIAKCIINRNAYPVFQVDAKLAGELESHDKIQTLGRERDALVKTSTALANQIHCHVKVLFPGFLDNTKDNPVSPFSQASLYLMERDDFSVACYANLNVNKLTLVIEKKTQLAKPAEKAEALIQRAREELPAPPHLVRTGQLCLRSLVGCYRKVQEEVEALERALALALAKTPAAVMTTIPGIAIVRAAGIGGELGHVQFLGSVASLCCYAGVVPGIDQSGGPDKPARSTPVKRRCNRRLKNHLVGAVKGIGEQKHGPPELVEEYGELKAGGQHADFVMARRFLRMVKTLMRYRTIYLPPHLRSCSNPDDYYEYLKVAWPAMVKKWREVKALHVAFADDAPLGFWRKAIMDLLKIDLPLDGASEVRWRGGEATETATSTPAP